MKLIFTIGFIFLLSLPSYSQYEIGVHFPVISFSSNNSNLLSILYNNEKLDAQSDNISNKNAKVYFSGTSQKNINRVYRIGFEQNSFNIKYFEDSGYFTPATNNHIQMKNYGFIFSTGIEKNSKQNKLEFLYGYEWLMRFSPRYKVIETAEYSSGYTGGWEEIDSMPAIYSTGLFLTGKIYYYFNRIAVGINTTNGFNISMSKGTISNEISYFDEYSTTFVRSSESEDTNFNIYNLHIIGFGLRYSFGDERNEADE